MNIDDYAPEPRKDPLTYPGKRPENSFLFYDNYILPVEPTKGKNHMDFVISDLSLSDKLDQMGATDLDSRYLIIGYGSNANPAQLRNKFGETSAVIPVLRGTMENFDIVYAKSFAPYGSIPATITESPGTSVEVWVTILDSDQLKIMDQSEGRDKSYWMAKIDGETLLENNKYIPSYSYVHARGALLLDGEPISISNIPAKNRKFIAMNQCEILSKVASMLGESEKPKEFASKVALMKSKYREKLDVMSGRIPGAGFKRIALPQNPPMISDIENPKIK